MTGKKENFKPIKEGHVSMYVCGPTVYSESHIGHARSQVSFDVIFRYLKYRGFHVTYARNYTDIDDKIIKRANDENVDFTTIAARYTESFDNDMKALGVSLPTLSPKATETISEMIDFISGLIDKGYAYEAQGDVLFRVKKFENYGKLSGKNIDDLLSGARVEVDKKKEDPLDFALWKASKDGEPSWDSPFGKGRPGWHIECSAMIHKMLGDTIDIHGGGKDLSFPHHENEIAQSEAFTGKKFVNYWMHNGFVNINKDKMSKSIGNVLNIEDILKRHTREALRHFFLNSHYRSPIDYSDDLLKQSEAAAERLMKTLFRIYEDLPLARDHEVERQDILNKIAPAIEAMDDDFNTARALAFIYDEVTNLNKLIDENANIDDISLSFKSLKVVTNFIGFTTREPKEFFEELKSFASIPKEEIEKLIKERNNAKKNKDFERSDEIREELKAKGIILEDTREGTTWSVEN